MLKYLSNLSKNKTIKIQKKIPIKININDNIKYLKKNKNNKCCNSLTKTQFKKNSKLLENETYNGLCVCCGKPIKKNIDKNNYDCSECPNGHKIHKSCKKYLEKSLIVNNYCPICGLIVENKTCENKVDNVGGKSNKTRKNKKR